MIAGGRELEGSGDAELFGSEVDSEIAVGHFAVEHDLVAGAEAAILGESPWNSFETVFDLGEGAIEGKRFTCAAHVVVLGPGDKGKLAAKNGAGALT